MDPNNTAIDAIDEDERLTSLQREVLRLHDEIIARDRTLGEVFGSKSWRITRPLRSLTGQKKLPGRESTPESGTRIAASHDEASYPLATNPLPLFLARSSSFPEAPYVSIVILNWNRAQLTKECVHSILLNTGSSYPFEIVVLDNCSGPQDFAELTEIAPYCNLIRAQTNLLFGEGNNVAVERARGEITVLLNNDVLVRPGWLHPLVDCLKSLPDVGAVGSHLLFPDGRTQEAGCFINNDGTIAQVGRSSPPPQGWLEEPQEVDFCSAACLAVRTADFKEVGGFDFVFEPAYYEDTDLCLRLQRTLGKSTYVTPASKVVHREHSTMEIAPAEFGMGHAVATNQLTFRARWGLQHRPLWQGLSQRRDAPVSSDRGTVFRIDVNSAGVSTEATYASETPLTAQVATPYPLVIGGGERYILSLAKALSRDCSTNVVVPREYSRSRLPRLGDFMDIDLSNVGLMTENDAAVNGPADIHIYMDNHLLPYRRPRGRRLNVYLCQFPFPMSADAITSRWGYLDGFDLVLMYSRFAAEQFEKQARSLNLRIPPITILPPPVPQPVGEIPTRHQNNRAILSIGRFSSSGHAKKQDLLVDAFRRVNQLYSESELTFVGSLSPVDGLQSFAQVQNAARALPVTLLPNASQHQLEDQLSRASVLWHGTGLGVDGNFFPERLEHFGIAPLEAMARGVVPFAIANGGPAEYINHGKNGFVYRTIRELVELTEQFFTLPEHEATAIRQHAVVTAQLYSPNIFDDRVRETIAQALTP
jgi:GT2 family glycosyltransferase/glycosyltransferase involved in cell wall biosynthesis